MAQRIVIITGCSTGIGLSTAVLLAKDAEKKFKVYACMRNLSKKDGLVERAAECVDKTLFVLQMDVCSETSVLAAIKQVMDKEGRVDVLINNAGIGLYGALEGQSWKTIQSTFDTNVNGVIRTIRAVLPSMKKEKKGHIINVSSVGGLNGVSFCAVYCSTKFAVEGLTEALAPELAQFNINVSLIEPGPVSSNFVGTVLANESTGLEGCDDPTKQLLTKTLGRYTTLLGAPGIEQTPDEVAAIFVKAVKAEKPHLRYITNEVFEKVMKKKFVDPSSDKSHLHIFYGVVSE